MGWRSGGVVAYSWHHFVNELLADSVSRGGRVATVNSGAATLSFGGIAFLGQNRALRRRPAVTVAPVIAR